MTTFFVSHSSADAFRAARVRELLIGEHGVVFLDFSPEDGIPPGREWEPELYRALRRADAVVFCSTAAARASNWCFAELAIARSLGKPILELRLDGVGHPLLGARQGMAWTDDAGAKELQRGLAGLGLTSADSFAVPRDRPAFPGLQAFTEADAGLFFGRADDIRRVLENLEPTSGSPVLAVIGVSGSGKSSLVHAGVLPRIRRNPAWEVLAILRSGERPLWQLATGLVRFSRSLGLADDSLIQALGAADPDLPRIAGALLENTLRRLPLLPDRAIERALILIDQGEELVNRAGVEERTSLARVLETATSAVTGALLSVLVTVRTESLAGWLEDPAVAKLIPKPVLIPPLSEDALYEVIQGPARAADIDIEPAAVASLVADTPRTDGLPLLAYALHRLEREAGGEPITLELCRRIGGVAHGVQLQADAALAELTRDGAELDPIETLLSLVTIDRGEPTRQPRALAGLTDAQRATLAPFEARRLLVRREDGTIDVAHEALLRQWAPLRAAIEAAADRLVRRAQLRRLAHEWIESGRSDAYLLAGERLAAALNVATDDDPDVRTFVETAAARDAETRRRAADWLAERALEHTQDEPELTLRLGLAARDEYLPTFSTDFAVSRGVARARLVAEISFSKSTLPDIAWSADGAWLAISDTEEVRLWSADGEAGPVLRRAGSYSKLAWSAAGLLATASLDGGVQLWRSTGEHLRDLTDGERHSWTIGWDAAGTRLAVVGERRLRIWRPDGTVEHTLEVDEDGTPIWSPTDNRLVVDSTATITFVAAGEIGARGYQPDHNEGVSWSVDGRYVVAAGTSTIVVWRASGEELMRVDGVTAEFSPDGEWLAVARPDRTVAAISLTGAAEVALAAHESDVQALAWADGPVAVLASSGADGSVRLATLDRGEFAVARGAADSAARLAWDASSRLLICSPAWEGRVRLLDADGDSAGSIDPAIAVDLSPDGRRMASQTYSGVQVWRAHPSEPGRLRAPGRSRPQQRSSRAEILDLPWPITPEHIEELDSQPIACAAWSPSGRLAATGDPGLLSLWRPDGEPEGSVTVDAQYAVGWSCDGRWLAAGGKNGLTVVDVAMVPSGGHVTAVAWSPTDPELLAGTSGLYRMHEKGLTTLRSWSAKAIAWTPDGLLLAAGEQILTAAGSTVAVLDAEVLTVAWRPDGHLLAVGDGEGIQLWSRNDHRSERAADGYAAALAWSPDGGTLAIGDVRGTVRFGASRIVGQHEGRLRALAWAPDGHALASGGEDGGVRLWAPDGTVGHLLTHHRAEVGAIAWSPDSQLLLSAARDGTAGLWFVADSAHTIELARKQVRGELSAEQRLRYRLPLRI